MISKVRFRKRETDQEDSTDKPPYTYKIYLIAKDIRIKPGEKKTKVYMLLFLSNRRWWC